MAYDVLWPSGSAKEANEASLAPTCAIEHRLCPGESCTFQLHDALRLKCKGFKRGLLTLDVQLKDTSERDLSFILCAGKSGFVPNLHTGDFNWISGPTPEGAIGWRCCIQTHWWLYECPDLVAIPVFGADMPALPPHFAYFTGVDFQPLYGEFPQHSNDTTLFQASFEFILEEATISIPELRLGHIVFHKAFDEMDGLELSAAGKEEISRDGDIELTYGEIQFLPFWQAVHEHVAPRPGETFVDLGSGIGRAVIAMALGFPNLQRCIGLELLKPLHEAAVHAAASMKSADYPAAVVEFQNTNFLDVDWESDADIVWVSSLCLAEETLSCIAERCHGLKRGSRIVTMSSSFGDGLECFEKTIAEVVVEMSFGESCIYVLRRT